MVQELDPTKFHILTKRQQKNILIITTLISLLLIPTFGLFYYKFAVFRPNQTDKELTFEITNGMAVAEIADLLEQKQIINSKFLFLLYTRINNLGSKIQAGVYTVPAGINLVTVTDTLQHGLNDQSVTFLEGWRVEEFGVEAATKLKNVDYSNFIGLAKNYEGYLFPDTYSVNKDIDETELVDRLRENFDVKTKDILSTEALTKAGLTKEQAVIFASIVEREAVEDDDQQVVAGILINRWKNGTMLGADATTQYAIAMKGIRCASSVCPTQEVAQNWEWWPKDLTLDDLADTSPYNTRKNVGLPPAPISNPGLNTITNVMNYKPTDYVFYLHDSQGNIFYAKTLAEHENNIKLHLQ